MEKSSIKKLESNCAVKLERYRSTNSSSSQQRRGSTMRQPKKMRTTSAHSVDEKKVKFSGVDDGVNSSTIKIMGQNSRFAAKMGFGKMNFGSKPRHSADSGIYEEEDVKPDLESYIPNCVQMTSAELVAASEALGNNSGNISTSICREKRTKGGFGCPLPPEKPATPLTKEELVPATPTVYIRTSEEAFSPHLLDFCLKHPIVLVRNLAPACNLDLQLYTTKTLVEMHPNHPVEIRNQIEQDSDENLDPSLTVPVWYCTSSRAHTTIAKYAEYQAGTLAEAWNGSDIKNSINPTIKFGDGTTRRWIKFGTNCDLSDDVKWKPQLDELMKLPAWARVISPSNMLSHMGHQILGMNTVQLYMKVPCARTPGHQENNNFCAVNINIGPGDSEWFGVPHEYWGALQRLCRKNDVDYLHGSWWPSMKELADAGIPCYRFMQRPGDLVYVNAGCVHWVQAAGWCNNIAWNIGPLSHRQYVLAIERYEWNKTQKFQSIVAMVLLTWNLARNITVSEPKLYDAIKSVLAESIRQTVQTLSFVRSKGRPVKFHGRRKNDPPHYCVKCEEEVFNTILILEREVPHVVNCLRCARKDSPDLSGWVCLEEYTLEELCRIYDNFRLGSHAKDEIRLKVEETAED